MSDFINLIKEKFIDGLASLIGWGVLAFLGSSLIMWSYNVIFQPTLSIKSVSIDILEDKQKLSPGNRENYGKAFTIPSNSSNDIISIPEYTAPKVKFAVEKNIFGNIKSMYVVYRNIDGELYYQIVDTTTLETVLNYPKEKNRFIYLVVVDGRDNSQKIWTIANSDLVNSSKMFSEKEIFNKPPYDSKDVYSLNRDDLQRDIIAIRGLKLNEQ